MRTDSVLPASGPRSADRLKSARLLGIMLSGFAVLLMVLVSCQRSEQPDGCRSLIQPERIVVLNPDEDSGSQSVVLRPSDQVFMELYREVNRSWQDSLDPETHKPRRVRTSHMKPDHIDRIELEVKFEYDTPVDWEQGNFMIHSKAYSFFPKNDDLQVAAISESGDYGFAAVVVDFKSSDRLVQLAEDVLG